MAAHSGLRWVLYGFGFNAFGQLNPSQGGTRDEVLTGKSHQETEDAGEKKVEFVVDTPKELMTFASKPSLTVSSSWDALHVHSVVESGDGACTHSSITTGRWAIDIDSMRLRMLKESDHVLEIIESKTFMIVECDSKSLVVLEQESAQIYQCDVHSPRVMSYSSLEDGSTYALLENGNVHKITFEVDSSKEATLTKAGRCLVNLGPQVTTGVPITQVVCGPSHTMLLSQNGTLYSFGLNSRGELGHGDVLPRDQPTVIEALQGIGVKGIVCGNWHCLALSEFGDVYSWGWNEHKQLGHSPAKFTVAIPMLIDTPEDLNFISISCGARHSAALCDNGVLYVWGWNGYGQLGCSSAAGPVVEKPSPMSVFERVESVWCGHWCTVVLARLKS